MLPALFATVVLHWTNPSFQADTSHAPDGSAINPCGAGADSAHLDRVNIYRAYVGGSGLPILIRTHYAVAGQADTIMVPDSPPASYFVAAENAAGEACRSGYTVGVPSVSVPLGPGPPRRELYDLAGRRVQGEPRSGVYFEWVLIQGKPVRRVVVIR